MGQLAMAIGDLAVCILTLKRGVAINIFSVCWDGAHVSMTHCIHEKQNGLPLHTARSTYVSYFKPLSLMIPATMHPFARFGGNTHKIEMFAIHTWETSEFLYGIVNTS